MADGTTFNADDLDQNEVIVLGERSGSLSITGRRNRVLIGEGARFDGQIEITGDDNLVEIGPWATVRSSTIWIASSNSRVEFGRAAGVISSSFQLAETSQIIIGEESAVSAECWMSTSDMHPIYSAATGRRLNPPRDIILGARAWVGFRSIVLKGARMGDDAILGAGSVLRGRVPAGTIACGNPATQQATGVRWEWNFVDQTASAPSNSGKARTA